MPRLLIAWLLASLAIYAIVTIDGFITGSYRISGPGLILISFVSPGLMYFMAPSRRNKTTSQESKGRSRDFGKTSSLH